MAIDFPSTPTVGQTLTVGSITWTYDGTSWKTSSPAPTATNLTGGTAGSLPYQSSYGTTAMLAPNLAGKVLTSNGAAAPMWADAPSYNYIINGGFDIWQRGTSFSNPASATYQADRYITYQDGTGTTRTISQQTFTPGAAPVAGYEANYYYRYASTNLGTGTSYQAIQHRVEDVKTLAGQTATFSFWAKADAAKTVQVSVAQNFGTGGSSQVSVSLTSVSLTTSWARYSVTFAVPSISGKTIGTGSWFQVGFEFGAQLITFDTWGWQLEAGTVATPFRRNSPNIQAELAACRRYLPAITTPYGLGSTFMGYAYATNSGVFSVPFDVPARVAPTGITVPTVSGSGYFTARNSTNGDATITALSFDVASINGATVLCTATLTAGTPARLVVNGPNGYILFTGCEL